MRTMNIAAAITTNLLDKIYVQMNSIKQNKSCQTMVDYYLFVECKSLCSLEDCAQYFKPLMSEDFRIHLDDAGKYAPRVVHKKWAWISYMRCLFPTIFPFTRLLLYLDSDVMCLRSGIEQLFDEPIDDYYVAAVSDPPVLYSSFGKDDARNTGNSDYFNSGVMLMNLDKLRKAGIAAELAKWCLEWDYSKLRYCWHDQTLCNYLMKDKVLLLPYKWNNQFLGSFDNSAKAYKRYLKEQGFDDPVESLGSTILLHFCGWNKPWKPEAVATGPAHYPWVAEAQRMWRDLTQQYGKKY